MGTSFAHQCLPVGRSATQPWANATARITAGPRLPCRSDRALPIWTVMATPHFLVDSLLLAGKRPAFGVADYNLPVVVTDLDQRSVWGFRGGPQSAPILPPGKGVGGGAPLTPFSGAWLPWPGWRRGTRGRRPPCARSPLGRPLGVVLGPREEYQSARGSSWESSAG